MRWRSGSSSRSSCRRRSSLARSLAVRSSYSLRLAPRPARAPASAPARFAGRPGPRRRSGAPALRGPALPRPRSTRACWDAVSIARCSSALRASTERCANCASCAWRSRLRCCSRHSASLRSASITWSSSWAWRSWLSASCMSSSSKRPSAVTRRSCSSSSRASTSARSAAICSLRARVCSASCVRRSVSTCSSCARLWVSAASRRAPHQALRRVGVGRLGAHQRRARLFGDQRLGPQLLFQVLDFLLRAPAGRPARSPARRSSRCAR